MMEKCLPLSPVAPPVTSKGHVLKLQTWPWGHLDTLCPQIFEQALVPSCTPLLCYLLIINLTGSRVTQATSLWHICEAASRLG